MPESDMAEIKKAIKRLRTACVFETPVERDVAAEALLFLIRPIIADCDRLKTENERLREALQFYSDPDRYSYDNDCAFRPPRGYVSRKRREKDTEDDILTDIGHRARAALSPAPQTGSTEQ